MTIHYNLPMHEYLADPRIGSSRLKYMLQSPADFHAVGSQPFEDTKATILGTAIHKAILEPVDFDKYYALQPSDWGPRNKKPGRTYWDGFKKQNPGKICLGYADTVYLGRIREAALKHQALRNILAHAKGVEVTAFTDDLFKARTDIESAAMLWDVKTTSKGIDDDSIAKTIYHMGYHFQAAHHNHCFKENGRELERYGWIFVSTETPAIHIRCVEASPELLAAGRKDFDAARKTHEACQLINDWPGYDDTHIGRVNLPAYAERFY